jgi:hypothetical protein
MPKNLAREKSQDPHLYKFLYFFPNYSSVSETNPIASVNMPELSSVYVFIWEVLDGRRFSLVIFSRKQLRQTKCREYDSVFFPAGVSSAVLGNISWYILWRTLVPIPLLRKFLAADFNQVLLSSLIEKLGLGWDLFSGK